jgi:hypothetical protein
MKSAAIGSYVCPTHVIDQKENEVGWFLGGESGTANDQ